MFCGECGSAVAPAPRGAAPVAAALAEPTASGRPDSAAVAAPAPAHVVRDDTPQCGQCGATMGLADIFCAECGFVAKSVADAYLTETRSIGIRTAPVVVMAEPAPTRVPEPDTAQGARGEAARVEHAAVEGAPVDAVDAGGPAVGADAVGPAVGADAAGADAAGAGPRSSILDTEATRLVTRGPVGARFVLQFSTGEQAVVTGTGLLGRNPGVQPGEHFDHVVSIRDPGRSVSKTHLEFGQDAGEFWVLDRFSGNGSVIRQPDHAAARCEPGRRYRIARGTRVDIGEQFFVVS